MKEFTKDGAIFEGESGIVVPLDDVILATGYRVSYPCLAPGVLDVGEDHQVDVYKLVFPPERPGLALIGLAQPIGALLPLSELQSRWAARVFAGKAQLPSVDHMWRQASHRHSLFPCSSKSHCPCTHRVTNMGPSSIRRT